jgi:N-acetyl-S-(2-succino)cysteine monooxygenase
VIGLWDSWEDDAFVRDKESGRFFESEKRHLLNHKGAHFAVRGPLNVARSPQGRPIIVQAGSSEAGKELAAETAEVIFTAQQTLAEAKAFYADVKGRLARYGRAPDDLKILPGVSPIVGRSSQEAEDKFGELQSLIHPEVGVSLLSNMIGVDISGYPVDGPLPELPETNSGKSRQQLLTDLARRENLTIRQLYEWIAGARGHWAIRGTPQEIADHLEERFVGEGADGFNVMPPSLPSSLDDFAQLVVPELRRRGLFRSEYEGRTLRENLGLRYPTHPAATARLSSAAAE